MQKAEKTTGEKRSNSSNGTPKSVKVLVGYGWQKFANGDPRANGREVLHDKFWQSLKSLYKNICERFTGANGAKASLGRLRASHGCLTWQSITAKIDEADILIFDVAACPPPEIIPDEGNVDFEKVVTELNSNVLVELGYALGKGKRVMLLCPKHLFDKIPSDLRGYLWTQYTGEIKCRDIIRHFVDVDGALSAFHCALREIANERAGIDNNED